MGCPVNGVTYWGFWWREIRCAKRHFLDRCASLPWQWENNIACCETGNIGKEVDA